MGLGSSVYVTGYTYSDYLVGIAGGYQSSITTTVVHDVSYLPNAFVAEFAPDLRSVVNATFLGGTGVSQAWTIAPSADGLSVYVAGDTTSTDFPVTYGAAQTIPSGNSELQVGEGFLSELGSDLRVLTASTYVGGANATDITEARAVAVSGQNVYVAGNTRYTALAKAAGGAQATFAGNGRYIQGDGYVLLYTSNLSQVVQSTYVGGTGDDNIFAIAVSGFAVYVAGQTNSPTLPNSGVANSLPGLAGGFDAFLAKLSPDLKTFGQNSFLGGKGDDRAQGIAVYTKPAAPTGTIATDQVLVVGYTESGSGPIGASLLPGSGFPVTAGVVQQVIGAHLSGSSPSDGFIVSLPFNYTVKCRLCAPTGPTSPVRP